MKKNILFVIPSLGSGGAEKSLVNLLNQIDYDKFNIDLFMFSHGGIFSEFLPKEVNILELSNKYISFSLPFKQSLMTMIKNKQFSLLTNKLKFTLVNKSKKDSVNVEQYNWKYLSRCFDKIDKNYDAAIGYLEKTSIYFCVDKVVAKKKIGFIHTDYDKSGMNPKIDINYFEKLDNIVTVSEECLNVLEKRFTTQKHKMSFMYNIVSPTIISKMSEVEDKKLFKKKNNEIIILSIGRLTYLKGFDMAIKACRKLLNTNYNVKWYIIGEGEEREKLSNLIKENNLEDRFILLGLKSNPYPYIKQADIYVQPSRYEGKSIALDEAKILNKPIVVTNYTTAKDQINHGIDGLIVDMDEESISEGIEKLIKDKKLKEILCNNLKEQELGTEKEIEKLYEMI